MPHLGTQLLRFARMVKLSHTAFALPFAFSGAILAADQYDWSYSRLGWIFLCMVTARNAAMGFNRLVDHAIDAKNPRTANRELPSGQLTRRSVALFVLALSVGFIYSAFQLGPLTGWLSIPALIVIGSYSFFKRFSWSAHLFLGLALAIAPVGGWLAIAGRFSVIPLCLGFAVAFWVAGFDVLYALQDHDFDKQQGLHSIPVRFGPKGALWFTRALHGLAWLTLCYVGWLADLYPAYGIGMILIAALLFLEQFWVRADDFSKIPYVFFHLNVTVAILYLITVGVAVWV